MPMTAQDQILNFLKITGPLLPSKVAKHIHESILISSAHLADLVTQGKVKISGLKVGGSPLYYLPGQEAQLYQFSAGNLNPKDLQVLNHLKSKLVLKETAFDTLSKLALRSLKDFAVPLHVTVENKRELFWKWHLLSDEQTNQVIGDLLKGAELKKAEAAIPAAAPASPSASVSAELPAAVPRSESSKIKPEVKESPAAKPKTELKESSPAVPEHKAERKAKEEARKKTVSKLEVKSQEKPVPENKPKEPEKSEEPEEPEVDDLAELLLESNKKVTEQKQKEFEKQTQLKSNKVPFLKKIKETFSSRSQAADPFLPVVEKFFGELRINVEEKELVRKDAEIDFIVRISSVVGETTYFCKARKKRKCDEKDLSAAYMQAQIKKLPLLFLYTNELNQKAQEMLATDAFKNALVKKIE